MTELLYLKEPYLKEFDAVVEEVKDNKFVVLDKTAFYPNGGGQLFDTGKLITEDGKEYEVVYVGKFNGNVSLEVNNKENPPLKKGMKVKGILDWKKRYKMMRSHTAAHLVSSIFHNKAKAKITGNQLGYDKIRIDFNMDNFDKEKLKEYIEEANKLIETNAKIKVYNMSREEAEKDESIMKLAKKLPEELKELRIVEIEGIERQADGGTHVKSLNEIGKLEFIKADNKGKNNRRVYFKLVD